MSVRVVLPSHLRALASLSGEVVLPDVGTTGELLDALEAAHPVLVGRVRDPATRVRRPFVRFYACEEDLSHEPEAHPLPDPVRAGREPFLVVGAMAGG